MAITLIGKICVYFTRTVQTTYSCSALIKVDFFSNGHYWCGLVSNSDGRIIRVGLVINIGEVVNLGVNFRAYGLPSTVDIVYLYKCVYEGT